MMDSGQARQLSERQHAVLVRLDQRIPIKVIAGDLGISETRVNQHIRALKQIFDAADLSDLVRKARDAVVAEEVQRDAPYRKTAYRIPQMSGEPMRWDEGSANESRLFDLADAHAVHLDVPWARTEEPRIVPGSLDGKQFLWRRLVVMIGMAAAMAAAVILVIAAAQSVSQVLNGIASVPASYERTAD